VGRLTRMRWRFGLLVARAVESFQRFTMQVADISSRYFLHRLSRQIGRHINLIDGLLERDGPHARLT